MRKSALLIQRFVRAFLGKKHAYKEKYEKFILPWEENCKYVEMMEEMQMYGKLALS